MKALLSVVVLTAIAVAGFNARAAEKPATTARLDKKHARVVGVSGVAVSKGTAQGVSLLARAYHHLETADHDYKGHRVRAMRQIEAAAKLVGANVHGRADDHEVQAVSDEHLRSAQSLLQDAAGDFSGKALVHIRHAISQLNIALSVK